MGRGRRKFFGVWIVLIGAALYLPFRQFLEESDYGTAEELFQDLLIFALIGGVVVVLPLALVVRRLRRRRRVKKGGRRDRSSSG